MNMKVYQRDVIEVIFQTGRDKFETHPAIVISNNDVLTAESFFYAVMLTHSSLHGEFVFEISDDMRTQPTKDARPSYAKCQLIERFEEPEVGRKFGAIKPEAFKRLMKHIQETVF